MAHKIQKYGWIPDIPDHRDFKYGAMKTFDVSTLPEKVDLTPQCPPVYDQGQIGSCTGNALAAAFQFDELKQQKPDPFMPSRLFIYYNERILEHTTKSDSGAMLRDGIKSLVKCGVCDEGLWPYDETKVFNKPNKNAYKAAAKDKISKYERIPQNLNSMKSCLSQGFPFVLGITVYESFESDQVAKTGIVNMPDSRESEVGGHAILCVGYDNSTQRFILRNSWGKSWGQNGYFTIPYEYLLNPDLSDDFWTITFVN